jgi:hypothetical protein
MRLSVAALLLPALAYLAGGLRCKCAAILGDLEVRSWPEIPSGLAHFESLLRRRHTRQAA